MDQVALESFARSAGTGCAGMPHTPSARKQRILAVVLPHLHCELVQAESALQELAAISKPVASKPVASKPVAFQKKPQRTAKPARAIVLTDSSSLDQKAELEGKTELDAVNATAHRLGIRPRQTIAQACAIVENLVIHALPRARLLSALKHIAEVALGFGSPVSFQAPDTVWVDISGSGHFYPSERELALELSEQIRALGHASRVAVADGPWLAQSFARHAQLFMQGHPAPRVLQGHPAPRVLQGHPAPRVLQGHPAPRVLQGHPAPPGPSGVLVVDTDDTERAVSQLPIIALPIHREAASWFARLGLLSIQDLRGLPPSALAARLADRVLDVPLGTVLDLIQGRDSAVLVPHQPEEMPREELFWEDPLENVEPLLFVLKGLSGRLSARLEGRGQAAQELLLTIHYDRSIAANFIAANFIAANFIAANFIAAAPKPPSTDSPAGEKSLSFKLASPLFHAEDLERVLRSRLQKQTLIAPTLGLSLQATSVTEARSCQLGLLLGERNGSSAMATDPRSLAVLVAELTADIGSESVGVLALQDSHLPEKSSALLPFCSTAAFPEGSPEGSARTTPRSSSSGDVFSGDPPESLLAELPRVPTRLFDPPIEVHAPIRKSEIWVIRERAFIVSKIHFEQRLEGVEWWAQNRIFRDYFRVWLAEVPGSGLPHPPGALISAGIPRTLGVCGGTPLPGPGGSGLEALVYRDRLAQLPVPGRGKAYLQALYD